MEDIEASYLDWGSVIDSNRRESGGVRGGEDTLGWVKEVKSFTIEVGHPSPNILARYLATTEADCLWVGTHLAISSPDGLDMSIVLVRVSTNFMGSSTVLGLYPGHLFHVSHYCQCSPSTLSWQIPD